MQLTVAVGGRPTAFIGCQAARLGSSPAERPSWPAGATGRRDRNNAVSVLLTTLADVIVTYGSRAAGAKPVTFLRQRIQEESSLLGLYVLSDGPACRARRFVCFGSDLVTSVRGMISAAVADVTATHVDGQVPGVLTDRRAR